jgi:hypothetical protein
MGWVEHQDLLSFLVSQVPYYWNGIILRTGLLLLSHAHESPRSSLKVQAGID